MMDVVGTLRRAWANAVAHLDFPLLLITAAIMAIGLGTVYSATYDSTHRMMSQAGNMGIALVVMWVVSRIPPQKLMSFAIPLYVIGIVLLIAVFLFGIKVNGARRWLSIGFTRVQPSEIMKIAMPLMLAQSACSANRKRSDCSS
jgi:rod shape determining protein RodA